MTMTPRPRANAVALTAGFAVLATLPLALVPIALGLAVTGGLVSVAGTALGSRRMLGIGVLALLAGALLAGAQGLPIPLLGVSIVGALLGWDAGEQSISVAGHLGRAGDPDRPIFVHVATSVVGVVVVVSPVYLVYSLASGGKPVATLVLLLVGAAFIISSMRL